MRRCLVTLAAALLLAAVPVTAQDPGTLRYRIELDKDSRVVQSHRERQGKSALYVTVKFKILRPDGQLATDVGKDEIIVEEDRRRVADLEIFQPRSLDALTTVLAMDISGSMEKSDKLATAKKAAQLFLDKLHVKTDCGLILFDHEMRVAEPPVGDPERVTPHREKLREIIQSAQPLGGTAYLDATAKAIDMMRGFRGRKAVLVMTDGVDLNSKRTLRDVIEMAQSAEVPVYTIGVGEPGKNEPVTTILALDRSGSMNEPADERDRIRKIEALKRAAARYIELMRPGAKTSLMPFNNVVARPKPFSDDKEALKSGLVQLKAQGGTKLYDAAYDAVETLVAARPVGKRAVVVLTDGIDESSRRNVEDVIRRAKEAQVPLHMLGLGRARELNEPVMRRMGLETGGTYERAGNEQTLYRVFENLSIQLHDDGIDEASLQSLAAETGGKYYPAREVSQLLLRYEEFSEELESTYTVTFPSQRSSHDGTARGIDISVVRNGVRVSEIASVDYNVHGVIVPEMDQQVYLVFLALLGALLAVPSGVRRLYRFYGGK